MGHRKHKLSSLVDFLQVGLIHWAAWIIFALYWIFWIKKAKTMLFLPVKVLSIGFDSLLYSCSAYCDKEPKKIYKIKILDVCTT